MSDTIDVEVRFESSDGAVVFVTRAEPEETGRQLMDRMCSALRLKQSGIGLWMPSATVYLDDHKPVKLYAAAGRLDAVLRSLFPL